MLAFHQVRYCEPDGLFVILNDRMWSSMAIVIARILIKSTIDVIDGDGGTHLSLIVGI